MGREHTPKSESYRGDLTARKSEGKRQKVELPQTFEPRFWEAADRRCSTVRAIKGRYESLKQDTACDSYQKDLLCQRTAFLSVILESMEVRAAAGGGLDLGSYVQGLNAINGLLKSLGLERRVKQAGGLKAYVTNLKGNHEYPNRD